MSMLRHRAARRRGIGTDAGKGTAGVPGNPAVLVYSARTWDDVIYRDELQQMAATDPHFRLLVTLTRGHPDGWSGPARRVDEGIVADALAMIGEPRHVFCCGSDGFVENAANLVVAAGVDPEIVRTERFGPTGS
jgi:ferredoxin-NADP reductase